MAIDAADALENSQCRMEEASSVRGLRFDVGRGCSLGTKSVRYRFSLPTSSGLTPTGFVSGTASRSPINPHWTTIMRLKLLLWPLAISLRIISTENQNHHPAMEVFLPSHSAAGTLNRDSRERESPAIPPIRSVEVQQVLSNFQTPFPTEHPLLWPTPASEKGSSSQVRPFRTRASSMALETLLPYILYSYRLRRPLSCQTVTGC
ncbi:hypothetical protein GE09DRAFT_224386 [Coniochaeta sp. 2T2.1]|nr:hypothetical protein GE09DRAFT_224386 [Coniochaeta sp. 2T2.1]